MPKIFQRFLCLQIFLLIFVCSFRAEVLPVKTYTVADGLLRDQANCIKQDPLGFLWFCTNDGLSRFDGYGFTNYTTADGLPHRNIMDFLEMRDGVYWVATLDGLVRFNPAGKRGESMFTTFKPMDSKESAKILKLFEDSRSRLWCGTEDGLYRIETKKEEVVFHRLDLPKDQTNTALPVSAIIEDKSGNLWVGMDYEQGLNRILPDGQIEHFRTERGQKRNESITTLLETSNSEIWVGMSINGGLCALAAEPNRQNSIFSRCFTQKDGLPGNWIFSLYQASDGKIWIGTTDGTASLDATNQFRTYKQPQGLCDRGISGFQEDRDGNLWVSSDCGIKKIVRSGFVGFNESDGLAVGSVNGIFTSPDGELFVITKRTVETPDKTLREAHRLNLYGQDKFKAVEPKLPPDVSAGWGGGQIIVRDKAGDWWLPSDASAVYRFARSDDLKSLPNQKPQAIAIPDSQVFRLYEDSRGDIWISTMGGGHLLKWEHATKTITDYKQATSAGQIGYVSFFAEDGAGTLWMSSEYADYLIRYRDGRFTILKINAEKPIGNVNSLYFDHAGRLWLATSLNGVGRVDETGANELNAVWYNRNKSLATDGTRGLGEDNFGRIYVGHGRGVDRIDPNTEQIKHYTTADGLPQGFNYNVARDSNGALWFGGTNGLARLVPEQDKPRQSPNILLTGLRLNSEKQSVSELGETALPELKLTSNQTQVSIDFLGLGASLGEELRYQYKLQGDWVETTQRSVDFANLAAGTYNFEVRAVTFDGLVSQNSATVSFTIAAPIWQRWWFLLLTAILITGLIYSLYRYRVAEILRVERVRTRIATELHDDIGANLSKISVLSEVARLQMTNGNEENSQLLGSIAEIARESVGTMSDIVWTINPKRDSVLEMTRKMREHAEETFVPQNVSVKFNSPIENENAKLPMDLRREIYLIFKEAVNNAAKHSKCQKVEIDFYVTGKDVFLQVKDDGKGFKTDLETSGNGLENMQARAENLGGNLEIDSAEKDGTTVRLKITGVI